MKYNIRHKGNVIMSIIRVYYYCSYKKYIGNNNRLLFLHIFNIDIDSIQLYQFISYLELIMFITSVCVYKYIYNFNKSNNLIKTFLFQ